MKVSEKKSYQEPKLMLLGDMEKMTAAASNQPVGENQNSSNPNRRP